jgi:hypothetical protein
VTAPLIGSSTFGFADGNGGHVCNLGSAPTVGQLDVLCVNSNTVVSTPSGFTAAPSAVGGQGAYVFRRIAAGGEGSTVTVTTSGNHDTQVGWSRWGNINAVDDAAFTTATGNATSSPAHSTNALAQTNELCLAFAALHNFSGANPSAPSWSTGFTSLLSGSQGTGSTAVVGFVAYKLTAGTAAESPSVSWTSSAFDRYMLTLTFTSTSGGQSAALGTTTETDSAITLGRAKARALGVATAVQTALPLGRAKSRALGIAAEADAAVAFVGVAVVPATLTVSSAAVRLTSSSAGGSV